MSFVGPVNQLGDAWVRPHDVELRHEPNGTTQEAQIERIVRLGFEMRVELVRDDGERLHAQLTRDEADSSSSATGDIVYVRTREANASSAALTRRRGRASAPRRGRELARGEVGERDLLEDGADVGAQGDPDVAQLLGRAARTRAPRAPGRGRSRAAPRRPG